MNTASAALTDFVSAIAKCRRGMCSVSGEEIPPISMSTPLQEVAKERGLESLYVPFDKINHTHKYKGTLGFCYREAYKLAIGDPVFIYCEGYATSEKLSIPLMHAWCVNRETQEVYDPVWNTKRIRGSAYCVLPLSLDFVNKVMLQRECYGVIDQLWLCKNLFDVSFSAVIHPDYHTIIL